jgi:hypothetical protein
MFHAAGLRHRYRDVNDSWDHRHIRHNANLIRIIHTVLQANYYCVRPNEWCHLFRRRRCIVGFDAEKDERAISNGTHLDCCRCPDSLLAVQFIEDKAFRVNCVSEVFSPDENYGRTRAGKHSAEISTYRACADDCHSRPFSSFAH